jgi:hypothetical protein
MPAAQAVQAVSKAYVDQAIAELTESLLTASGGTLSGPLYLNAIRRSRCRRRTSIMWIRRWRRRCRWRAET